jgi:4-hydroxybenzoate polyprenyltransferase
MKEIDEINSVKKGRPGYSGKKTVRGGGMFSMCRADDIG